MKCFYQVFCCVLILATGSLTACKKQMDTKPLTGSISGTYSPAGFVSSIAAVNVGGNDSTYASFDNDSFTIRDLQPGKYKVIFTAQPGVITPDTVLVTVIAGENHDIGTVVFIADTNDITKGSISGTVSPANAITGIKAVNQAQNDITYTAVADAASRNFKILNVIPGGYTISFVYASAATVQQYPYAIVTAGQNTDIGNISFQEGAFVKGIISPAGSVTDMLVNERTGLHIYSVSVDAATGAFSTEALPAGEYNLLIYTAPGFEPPANTSITLVAGQTTDAGTLVMRPNVLGGIPFSGAVSQQYTAPNLSCYSYLRNNYTGYDSSFSINMDNITGPGTYTCNGTKTSSITYDIRRGGGPASLVQSWSTNHTGGAGTVTITSIDQIKREIKGTFTATLVSNTAGVPNIVIDNGGFYFGY